MYYSLIFFPNKKRLFKSFFSKDGSGTLLLYVREKRPQHQRKKWDVCLCFYIHVHSIVAPYTLSGVATKNAFPSKVPDYFIARKVSYHLCKRFPLYVFPLRGGHWVGWPRSTPWGGTETLARAAIRCHHEQAACTWCSARYTYPCSHLTGIQRFLELDL